MHVRPILLAAGLLSLSACASSDYGYAYCYDAYGGPVGYYYGPFEPKPACARQAPPVGVFVVQENGYRGPYVSGPYPAPVTGVPVDTASREAAR